MIQGTTQQIEITMPFKADEVEKVRILFGYGKDNVVLKKETEDCVITDNLVSSILQQEDTFKFYGNNWIDIELRVLLTNGFAASSDIMKDYVKNSLDTEVL